MTAADARTRATEIVAGLSAGSPRVRSAEELLPLVYDQLRRLAGHYLRFHWVKTVVLIASITLITYLPILTTGLLSVIRF